MWSQKYKPKTLDEIIGNLTLIDKLKRYRWDKPILLHGGIGVGKTIIAKALADAFNWDIVEITSDNIDNALTAAQTASIFGTKKLILIDNVERLRKGVRFPGRELLELVKNTRNPTMLITHDVKNTKLATVKKYCEQVLVQRPRATTTARMLEIICRKEGIAAEKEILLKIAEKSGGDVRAAINDLETIAFGKESISEDDLGLLQPRDKSIDIFKALSKIFGARDIREGVEAAWDLEEEPRNLLLWLDENAPQRFTSKELSSVYHYLSRADIFISRITSRQYWGFLRYANPLMTSGIIVSPKAGIAYRYSYPSYIQAMSRTKKERGLKGSIGEKISPSLHVSSRVFARDYIPLFRALLKAGKMDAEELKGRFDLDDEEVGFLTG